MNREVLRLAGPAIVSNITVPLLGLCDTAIAGHLGNVASIGAISVGAMMLNVVVWLMTFLRMGTSGVSAQAFGGGERSEIVGVLRRALLIAAGASVVVLALQWPLLKLLLWYARPGDEVGGLAELYFKICIWGVPGQLAVMAVTGWFIGQQNTTVPMAIAIGMNVVNILLSLVLALMMDMGISGVALGTCISNWLGAVAAIILAYKTVGRIRKSAGRIPTRPQEDSENKSSRKLPSLLKVSGELFLRSACVMMVSISMTAFGARMGETTLAVNAVMMQFFIFFSYFMDGFAFAGEALVGRYVGAADRRMLRRSVKTLLGWGLAMATAFFMIYLFASTAIASLITNEETVIAGVAGMKLWVVLLPPITVFAFLFDGIYIGLTKTRMMLWSTLVGAMVFFGISCSSGESTHNNCLLWGAFEAYLLMRGLILGGDYVVRERKKY